MDTTIEKEVYARVGLAGNPSDGFYGKTLSCCIRNFSAKVFLIPYADQPIIISPNDEMDPLEFRSLKTLTEHADNYGYYGALRLIHATCALFYRTFNIDILSEHGFRISYSSSIPRQVGLGGSSALIVALLKALAEYFRVEDRLSKEVWSELAWRVENEELGIVAGLQDRVVQTYGGMVYMDFDRQYMNEHGHGKYIPMQPATMPKAFIAYTDTPKKFSGAMHNDIRYAYMNGDRWLIDKMNELGKLADNAKYVIEQAYEPKDATKQTDEERFFIRQNHAIRDQNLGIIFQDNWNLRCSIYGKTRLGVENLKMIQIADDHCCSAKLPGSGGAVIGIYETDERYERLSKAYQEHGFNVVKVDWHV